MKPQIEFLSKREIEGIHATALRILAEIGMRFPHQKVTEVLVNAGAKKFDNEVIQIPEDLVEEAIRTVPKRDVVTLYGRDQKHDVSFARHLPALACMTMAVNVIDPYTRKKRPASNEDLATLTRLAENLEQVRVNGGLVTPQEVPKAYNDWYTWATTIKNTSKHITGGMRDGQCVQDAAKMGALALGDEKRFFERPFISGWVLTLPPLGISHASLDALMQMSRLRIPAMVSSGPILGTSSPVTIAGTVVQAHAEILGCLVVSQLTQPGAPVVYTSFARGMDMKTGNISMACPEFGVLKVAMAQMGKFLELPVRMPAMLRDAKALDAQAGFETGMIGSLTALIADLMDGMQLDMDMVVDYPDLIFCNEAMASIGRLTREVEVSDDALAFNVIKETGPGGNFLAHTHTLEKFRQELWTPALFERGDWDSWESSGSPDIFRVAQQRMLEFLSIDPEPLLPESIEKEIDTIVAKRVNKIME